MPINQETLNQRLYNELRTTEAEVLPQDTDFESTTPQDAELFRFHFIRDNVDYGEVTASLDGTRKLTLWYDERIANSPKHFRDGTISWEDLAKKLKAWCQSKQLSFDLQPSSNIDKLKADLVTRKQNDNLQESYHAINKKTSINDNIPTVKVRIQHNREMQEGEQRFRAVDKIFIENAAGERILAPTTKPGVAQVYARHLAEGGLPHDERWNHINSLVEEYNKMAGFVRATRGHQFNESTQQLVTEGINHYFHLRESLSKMRGKKGYNSYFESWTPPLMESEEEVDLSEMFMQSSLDPRIESVMPILGKLKKNLGEDVKMNEVAQFEAWANDMVSLRETDEDEADYGDDYQAMVQRVGKKAKEQEKKNPVDIEKLAKKLQAAEKKIKGKEKTEEGWKGQLAGGVLGGEAGAALGTMVAPGVGTAIGSALGGIAGGMAGDKVGDMMSEEQLNEFGPAIAAGARALIPLIARIGPALGRAASTAGKGAAAAGRAAAPVAAQAGKAAVQGAGQAAKAGAEIAAKNAPAIGTGLGIYSAITDIANSLVGGVGEVYKDAGEAAKAIAQAVGNAVDQNTIGQLAQMAAKYAIPIGIVLALLYGGKKVIDKVLSEDELHNIKRLSGI